jgi:transcription elongation GreA/GreB family factor
MIREQTSNSEYLDGFLAEPDSVPKRVLLPHESAAVEAAMEALRKAEVKNVEEKMKVSGGDDWHDGAFRATDNEARVISERKQAIAPFIGAAIIAYPEESETRVTLGSRVRITQAGSTFPVDIVGFIGGYPEGIIDAETNEEIAGMSPESLLAKAVIGKRAGDTSSFRNGDQVTELIIGTIDQSAIWRQFLQPVNLETQSDAPENVAQEDELSLEAQR